MAGTSSTAEIDDRVNSIVDQHSHLEGPLLPILHAVQEELGCVPQEALPIIAGRLNLSRAEVHGVASFYHDFREQPAGRHTVRICRAEACQSMGADRVAEHAKGRFKLNFGETAADGTVTLEAVYCLGLCACAPAAMVDGKVVGRVDEARIDAIAEEVRA
ncbi:formate dehydrogenase subunit gamma [Oricola thermophila]|uniref:formate dehydrogenase subunit gamma n=1 Tax=Oricola thermophila TaxID=2742145 RepID=UPI003D17F21C